jgi:hypothetical protein
MQKLFQAQRRYIIAPRVGPTQPHAGIRCIGTGVEVRGWVGLEVYQSPQLHSIDTGVTLKLLCRNNEIGLCIATQSRLSRASPISLEVCVRPRMLAQVGELALHAS